MSPASFVTGRRQLLSGGVGAAITAAAGPLWASQPARAATASDDPALVRLLLETLHPGLYRYQSPRQFDRAHRRFASEWAVDERLEARYLALSRLLSAIRCGHSYANFFNQRQAVADALFDRPTRLPFAFRWIGDAMVVTANQSGTGGRPPVWLPVGSVIKAVDGVPVGQIYRRLLPYVRVDGHNDGKARSLLSVSGTASIEFFDVFHGLLFGPPDGGSFRIDYRTPGGSADSRADMPALTLTERRGMRPPASEDRDAAQWQWTMRDDGIAVLRMDGWAVYNSRWDWRAWLNERLDSLSGARGLIVDIRQNEGGLDCGDLILARLATSVLPRATGRRLVRYRSVPDHLRPMLDTWDRGFFDWGEQAVPHDATRFELRRESADEGVTPDSRRLTVPVAVLTSAQNSSAAMQFALRIKQHRLGLLVGETTGGNQRGINGGAFFFARLPQSGLEFDLPLIGHFPDEPRPDAGVEPDISVMPSAEDIATGHDPVLQTAVARLLR